MSITDNIRKYFSPKTALKRTSVKLRLRQLEAASRKPRLANWGTDTKKETSALDLKTIRDRSRYLINNNPLGARALEVYSTYIIGNGITPHAVKNGKQNILHNKKLKAWVNTTNIDIQGINNLYGLQTILIKHLVRDGEVFCQKIMTQDSEFPLKIKIIEASFLDRNKNDKKTKSGIDLDKHGKPLAYWFVAPEGDSSKRISADSIIHIINQDDNSLNPKPFLTPAIVRMNDLDLYQDFELQKQKLSSLFCGIMREIEPTEIADHTNIKELEAGSIIKAPPGFSVDFSTPPSVEGYSDYIRQANLTIATALSIPYSLLASDWSESNYSSLKACYLSWFRYVEQKQNIFVTQFCNKLFKWYLESCELTGFDIKGVKAIWALPKKDILDLQKELNAYETGLKNNIFSLKQILRERGNDPDEFLTEIADTQKQLQELGIKQQEEEEE